MDQREHVRTANEARATVRAIEATSTSLPSPPARRPWLVGLGAIVVAAGVGLVPHLLKNGLTPMSVASVVFLSAGLTMVVVGVRTSLRDRHPLAKLAGGTATLIVVAVALSIVAPAVAATSVPSTDVTSTPATVGLEFESVTLTTSDGAELAAWYLPGSNRAGLVVMHGSGSTRSEVLDQAAVLAGSGYAVVLVDARGHGDSNGKAMDFGWYGDLDIAAGTEFLASQAEIDPYRIGVVGFSMGGEEAIGAAATDPRIRAVVAEGASGRQAADKEWLSDAYGWRGWLQERLEYVQYGLTDLLTEASRPISLRSAVVNAPDTRFLLITAGNVDDEGRAASYIQAGADERVTLWTVDGADHTGGYATRPQEWQQRVVEFLDGSLFLPPRRESAGKGSPSVQWRSRPPTLGRRPPPSGEETVPLRRPPPPSGEETGGRGAFALTRVQFALGLTATSPRP